MIRCKLLGHSPVFRAEGPTMRWECRHGCGAGGAKDYATEADARRYAVALNRTDSEDVGRRAPLGAAPLRLWRLLRKPGAGGGDEFPQRPRS